LRHQLRRAAIAIALAGSADPRVAAQSAQEPPQERPKFRVESNFVRVDAYPVRDGKPVLDLKADDFEVYEDGALQKIETFEHVVVRPAGPQEERVDPGSQRAALAAAANPRNRVFIIFLDLEHVQISSAHAINEPLIRLMDRILAPDDLVAVMTTEMAAAEIVFTRKTQVIEDGLRRNWPWGKRFSLQRDERERSYAECYQPMSNEQGSESELTKEMIRRKRERQTLDKLQDLVRYLRTVREERKAIITITEGWLLYGPNDRLTDLRQDPTTGVKEGVPTLDPVVVGSNGQLTTRDERRVGAGMLTRGECAAERMALAQMDNQRYFRDIFEEANRSNASFYPIDPRGLPAFDTPIGPEPPPTIAVDRAMLRQRLETLRTLALNTDGMAVLDNNDLDRGLRRIADDLNSYYLLGYYSTNPKLDGRFRAIRVRVKQPRVDVRARRGYKAATAEEAAEARRAADAPVPEIVSVTSAAIERLGRIRPEARFRVNAAHAQGQRIWIAGELHPQSGPDPFANGATVSIDAVSGGKTTSTKLTLKPGERTFLAPLDLHAEASEAIDVRARVVPAEASAALTDAVGVDRAGQSRQPLIFRRGPSTGNRQLPAADFRFSRTERMHLEIPVDADVKPGAGRLLDRAAQPLQVPVTVGERVDADTGQRWITADITLAPLSAGDYAIEIILLGPKEERVISGVRVTR
jgi:VWFA-related protein